MDYQYKIQGICNQLGIGEPIEPGSRRERSGPLTPGDLVEAVGEHHGEPVNCYPGIPGGHCCDTAYFFSLKDPRWSKRGHLSLDQVLDQLISHLVGHCPGITTTAIVVFDNWDPKAFAKWADAIRNLSGRVHIEFYFVAPREIMAVRV